MSTGRLRDVLVAGTGLLALLPLFVVIAFLLLVTDGRPVFFLQDRSGLNKRVFRVFKFRTMSDKRDLNGLLLPDDQRITPIGRLLRAVRIDELPQLWNVLLGDMSLVGPRPLLPMTIAAAGETGVERSKVQPGMTGWAQVNGNTLLSDKDKIALDIWYVANRSLALDLQIIGRTLLVVFFGERLDPVAIRRAHARSPHRRG